MRCYFCGMESRSTDNCEYCKGPLQGDRQEPQGLASHQALAPRSNSTVASQPALSATQPVLSQGTSPASVGPPNLNVTQPVYQPGVAAMAPPPNTAQIAQQPRVSLTGDVIEVTQQVNTGPSAGAYPAMAPPPPASTLNQPGTLQSAMRQAAYQTPLSAMTMSTAALQTSHLRIPTMERWERFLAIFSPIALVAVVAIHYAPGQQTWITIAAVFIASIVMGATGTIPAYEDAYADVGIVLLVTFLLGPFLGLVIYGIVSVMRQDINQAVVGILAVNFLVRTLLLIAVATNASVVLLLIFTVFFDFITFFTLLISLLGWMMSSFFRPLNE